MKKAPVFLQIGGTLLAGLFALCVFLAEHADLIFRGIEREEDPASRTVRYKTKNGFFSVGGTGLSLPKLHKLKDLFRQSSEEEIILTEPEP